MPTGGACRPTVGAATLVEVAPAARLLAVDASIEPLMTCPNGCCCSGGCRCLCCDCICCSCCSLCCGEHSEEGCAAEVLMGGVFPCRAFHKAPNVLSGVPRACGVDFLAARGPALAASAFVALPAPGAPTEEVLSSALWPPPVCATGFSGTGAPAPTESVVPKKNRHPSRAASNVLKTPIRGNIHADKPLATGARRPSFAYRASHNNTAP
mmetsp:Transcript_48264/g.140719  ORF Transcript_48264/g.140719 Transcript_48264/m.140719 type:complete len:210 (-) Transcript_48264:2153-2782(-)